MNTPPQALAISPGREIPPLVPLGTGLRLVTSMGLSPRTEPISEAHVSPQQQDIAPRQAKRHRVGVCMSIGLNTNPPPPPPVLYRRHSDTMLAANPLQTT